MLEKATVTMPYSELESLISENKRLNDNISKVKEVGNMTIEEFESHPFKKGLDTIFDLLEKASKYSKANEKQYFIYKSMIEYCKIFEIPECELMDGVPSCKELII